MDSLRLDLGQSLTRELENAPPHIQARVDERQKTLLQSIRQFYDEKSRELQTFVHDQLSEAEKEPVSELDQSLSEPKLKSIVKRRPSSSDKRVSFINSPEQVPITSGASTDTEGTEEELVSPEDPAHFDAPLGITSENQVEPTTRGHVSMTMPALDLSALTKREPAKRPHFLDDGTVYSPSGGSTLVEPEPLDHEDLFNFQSELDGRDASERDASERPAVEIDQSQMAQNHHAPLTDSSPRQKSLPQARPQPPPPTQSGFTVGSAPISIHSSAHGLDGDGGPLPRTEAEREEEASLSRPEDLASLPRSKMNELDPSQMSFSQRMEWESLRRRNGS